MIKQLSKFKLLKDARSRRRIFAFGFSWCCKCKQYKSHQSFGKESSRWNGLDAKCISCRAGMSRKGKVAPKDRVHPQGRRFVKPRDGDKKQARGRVNHLVRIGHLPSPNSLPCVNCRHEGSDRRHEYHHYLGYDAEHHEDVVVLCSFCHVHTRSERKIAPLSYPVRTAARWVF